MVRATGAADLSAWGRGWVQMLYIRSVQKVSNQWEEKYMYLTLYLSFTAFPQLPYRNFQTPCILMPWMFQCTLTSVKMTGMCNVSEVEGQFFTVIGFIKGFESSAQREAGNNLPEYLYFQFFESIHFDSMRWFGNVMDQKFQEVSLHRVLAGSGHVLSKQKHRTRFWESWAGSFKYTIINVLSLARLSLRPKNAKLNMLSLESPGLVCIYQLLNNRFNRNFAALAICNAAFVVTLPLKRDAGIKKKLRLNYLLHHSLVWSYSEFFFFFLLKPISGLALVVQNVGHNRVIKKYWLFSECKQCERGAAALSYMKRAPLISLISRKDPVKS